LAAGLRLGSAVSSPSTRWGSFQRYLGPLAGLRGETGTLGTDEGMEGKGEEDKENEGGDEGVIGKGEEQEGKGTLPRLRLSSGHAPATVHRLGSMTWLHGKAQIPLCRLPRKSV